MTDPVDDTTPVINIIPTNDERVRNAISELIAELVKLRKERGYSQPNMAKMLGSHLGRIRHLENGHMDPIQLRVETALRYALAIGAKVTFKVELPELTEAESDG